MSPEYLHCCVLLHILAIVLWFRNSQSVPRLRRVADSRVSRPQHDRKDVTQIGTLELLGAHFQLFVRDSFLLPHESRLNVSLPSKPLRFAKDRADDESDFTCKSTVNPMSLRFAFRANP